MIASELERLHLAGAKWRTFAVLYRGTRIAISRCERIDNF